MPATNWYICVITKECTPAKQNKSWLWKLFLELIASSDAIWQLRTNNVWQMMNMRRLIRNFRWSLAVRRYKTSMRNYRCTLAASAYIIFKLSFAHAPMFRKEKKFPVHCWAGNLWPQQEKYFASIDAKSEQRANAYQDIDNL